MRVLVFSDLHLHKWSDFSLPTEDGGNTRLDDGLSVFKKVGDIAIRENVQLVVFNGDLFHRRGLIDTFVFNRAYEGIADLSGRLLNYDIRIVLIAGNHDQAARVMNWSTALYPFKAIQGVTVYMSPSIEAEPELGFIPYIEAKKDVARAFKQLRKCKVIFFHGGINGAATGPLEYQPKEELKPEELPSQPLILCGHYHKRQQLRENIWYVGSPMQHVRGDQGDEKKGCVIADTKTRKLKWFNFSLPKFVVRQWPDVTNVEGNFVDVTFDPYKIDLAKVSEVYNEAGARAAQCSPVVTVNDNNSRKRIKVDATLNYDRLMERYVDRFSKKLKQEKLLQLGRDLLGRQQ